MKQLVLVRHGKSSWEYGVSDRDRPLSERGINDALLVSQHFADKGEPIEGICSSPANRALHTCMIFMRQLSYDFRLLTISEQLYDFSGESVLLQLRQLPESQKTVLFFGHNHAFTHIANALGSTYIDNVPTSGLVQLKFDVDSWSAVEKGTTIQTIFPKHIR